MQPSNKPSTASIKTRNRFPTNTRSYVQPPYIQPATPPKNEVATTSSEPRLRLLFRSRSNPLSGHDPTSFQHGIKLVRSNVLQFFRRSRRPVNLHAIDFLRRTQAKMHPQIILREITSAAVNFVGLRH